MEALEKMVCSLNGVKRPRIALSAAEQRKVFRLLSRVPTSSKQKSINICRTLLDYGLLTGCVSSQLVVYFTTAKSIDGLLALMEKISDLPESCLVKILTFATATENGTKPAAVNSDNVPLILRVLRYPYSPPSLTQELKLLPREQVLTMLRLLNCLIAQLLVSPSDSERVPSLDQVSDFLNCLIDASARSVVSGAAEFASELRFSSTLAGYAADLLSFSAEAKLRKSKSTPSESSRRLKDYSIQVLAFKD